VSLAPGDITTAWHVTHIETPVSCATVIQGSLVTSLAAQQLKTYRLALPVADPGASSPVCHNCHLPLIKR